MCFGVLWSGAVVAGFRARNTKGRMELEILVGMGWLEWGLEREGVDKRGVVCTDGASGMSIVKQSEWI